MDFCFGSEMRLSGGEVDAMMAASKCPTNCSMIQQIDFPIIVSD